MAIKLLKEETYIPEGAKKTRKDLGYHLSLCQTFAKSRREEMSIAMFMDDMWCFVPVVGIGFKRKADKYCRAGGAKGRAK